ncbi:hypothetical protein [Streptomyces vilmorinianum]|uniref:hypothetical protein n=1 Tax=Streptomyces vilmorinianum TaxID=3051092 RepID=UPI0010FB4770|nr:hypothetical protein [Streptomyces vilmorinianum]
MPRWAVVLLVVAGALIVLTPVAVLGGYVYVYGKVHEGMRFPSEDVTVARCALDPVSRRPVAELAVTSEASRRGSYTVTLEFQDASGGVRETGTAYVEDLPRGASERAVIVGAKPFGDGVPECVVVDAEFLATSPRTP